MEESGAGSWRASKQHAEKQELESTREPRCWGANVPSVIPSVFRVASHIYRNWFNWCSRAEVTQNTPACPPPNSDGSLVRFKEPKREN